MQANDRLEADKAIVRNAVEEYVYDMRNRLCEELLEFISEEVRAGLGGGFTRWLLFTGTKAVGCRVWYSIV